MALADEVMLTQLNIRETIESIARIFGVSGRVILLLRRSVTSAESVACLFVCLGRIYGRGTEMKSAPEAWQHLQDGMSIMEKVFEYGFQQERGAREAREVKG